MNVATSVRRLSETYKVQSDLKVSVVIERKMLMNGGRKGKDELVGERVCVTKEETVIRARLIDRVDPEETGRVKWDLVSSRGMHGMAC